MLILALSNFVDVLSFTNYLEKKQIETKNMKQEQNNWALSLIFQKQFLRFVCSEAFLLLYHNEGQNISIIVIVNL